MIRGFSDFEKKHIKSVGERHGLSRSELPVFEQVLSGKINREISEFLFCAEKTVKFHLGHIFKKTSCSNRTQLFWLLKLKFPPSPEEAHRPPQVPPNTQALPTGLKFV